MTIRLPRTLEAWAGDERASTLKAELEALDPAALPLQAAMRLGNRVLEEPVQVSVLRTWERGGDLHARIGVFFRSVVAGCACDGDPTPMEAQNEYAELELRIHGDGRADVEVRP